MQRQSLRSILERDLARAEAIIYKSEHDSKKLHGPTIDNFRGQALALKRALALLEMEESLQQLKLEIQHNYIVGIPPKVLAILAVGGIMLLLWAARS